MGATGGGLRAAWDDEVFEIGAFPPIRKKEANGWGTELVQTRAVGQLEAIVLRSFAGVRRSVTAQDKCRTGVLRLSRMSPARVTHKVLHDRQRFKPSRDLDVAAFARKICRRLALLAFMARVGTMGEEDF